MSSKFDQDKLWKFSKVMLQVVMGLIYIGAGIFVIQKQWFMVHLEPFLSYAMGGVLIVYGLIRIYRAYTLFK